MNGKLSNVATSLMVACALVMTAAVARREFFAPRAGVQAEMRPRRVGNWAELVSAGQRIGPKDAPVQIVEFSDFQCPFCARTHPVIEAVQARHPSTVSVLFRHFPLESIHPYARPAAVASECAAEQGRFEAFATLAFAQQDSLASKPWDRFAAEAGVPDAARFAGCVREGRPNAAVTRDARLGSATQVQVTPTLVINGTLYPGALTETRLEELVRRAGAK